MLLSQLVPGRRYRITGISNNSGVFIRSIDNRYAQFNNLILSGVKERSSTTRSSYRVDEWTFHNSAETLLAIEVARSLSDCIPEDAAGIIESFLIGKNIGSGPYRYPRL